MQIIIIDDEFSSLNTFLTNIIDETDLVYTMFMDNTEGALEYAKKNDIDAAFLDINMPKINGVDLAQSLIKIRPQLKIVFITGFQRNEEQIKLLLKDNLLGFCNKPYDKEQLLSFIAQIRANGKTPEIFLKTFPSFDVFVNGKSLVFQRNKCKELLALLTDRRGSTVQIGEAIACLWADKQEDLAKKLYRDAVSRLRLVLDQANILFLVNFGRGCLSLNCENATCDLWNYLDNEKLSSFSGEYMIHYDWSIDKQTHLDILAQRRLKKVENDLRFN